MAVKLYELHRVTLGQAAAMIGYSKRGFMDVLGQMGLPVADYPAAELADRDRVVKQPAVVDSACLIGLERIGRLDLLPALAGAGVRAAGRGRQSSAAAQPWMRVASPSDQGMVATLKLIVDPGRV